MKAIERCLSPVPAPRPRFSLAIPASILATDHDLRGKTVKAGLVGRAAAIFRVDEIHLFPHGPASYMALLRKLLEYLEAPPYLKKRLFRLDPELRYAGLMPPLQAPHHPLKPVLEKDMCREAVITGMGRDRILVDVGLGKPFTLIHESRKARRGQRITVKILDPEARIAVPAAPEGYWGYKVYTHQGLGEILRTGSYDLVIGTSRRGVSLASIWEELREEMARARRVLVLFGAPTEGLPEIFEEESLDHQLMDFLVNFIPRQGVRTVRTEEAVYIVLGILNTMIDAASP